MDSPVSDQQLLREFLHSRDERLLRPLMERHLPLIYATALRATGDPGLAAEATQDVFIKLVRTPGTLMKDSIPLIAWLHRTARHRAIDLKRTEKARRERERIAADLSPAPSTDVLPQEALGMLDEILEKLPPLERDLVLQRYFLGRQLSAIGQQKGLTEDAVRMRLKRALEKMRRLFHLRGVTTTTALLASALPSYGFSAPPLAVTAGVIKAISSAGAASQLSLSTLIHFMTTTQKYTAGASVLLLAGILTVAIPSFSRPKDQTASSFSATRLDNAAASKSLAGEGAPSKQRPNRTASDYPELVQKYGESRTKLAVHLAKNVAQLASDTAEIGRSTKFSAEMEESRKYLLNSLSEALTLRDDQKESLFQLIPEWQQRSIAQATKLAELAQAHPSAIAETTLAIGNWNDGKIGDDELQQVLSQTSATLGEGNKNVLELLRVYEFGETSGDPFQDFPELSRQVENILEPEQAERYRELQGKNTASRQLKKVSLENASETIERRTKQTALWAQDVRHEGK